MPRTSPSALTISVTTRPQPPWRFTRRRNAVSVMPAIGAMANGDARSTEPIFMSCLRACTSAASTSTLTAWPMRFTDRHEPRLRRVLAHQAADDAAQRTVHHLDHHALRGSSDTDRTAARCRRGRGCCRARSRESAPASRRTTRCSRRPCTSGSAARRPDRSARSSSRETAASRSSSCDPSTGSSAGSSAGTRRSSCARAARGRPVRGAIASRSRTSARRSMSIRAKAPPPAAFMPSSNAFFTSSFFHSMIA